MPNRLRISLARLAALLLLGGAGVAATSFIAPAVAAGASTSSAAEDPAARAAVTALLDDSPESAATAIPADFDALMEYQPVIEAGLLVNPDGSCSSPVPLPASFQTPCRAHDLGYDLLRFAELKGGRLGPWARQGIDAKFSAGLHGQCGSAACTAMANTAATAVDVNSRRQMYSTPVREPVALYVLGGAGVAALIVVPGWRAQVTR